MDDRPNDHDHRALSHDLPLHIGNTDQFPPTGLAQPEAGERRIARAAHWPS